MCDHHGSSYWHLLHAEKATDYFNKLQNIMSVTTVCFELPLSKTESGKSDQEASDQDAHTTYHLLAVQQEPYKKKSLTQNKNCLLFERKKRIISRKMTRLSKKTRQKSKRGDRKGESNDSPHIPGRVLHQQSMAPLWGSLMQNDQQYTYT